MEKLSGVLEMILPVLLMLAAGAAGRKIIKKDGIEGLKSLVVNVTLPAVLIKAFITADYNAGMVLIATAMFAVCLAALGLGFAFKKLAHTDIKSTPFLLTGFEAGMLGYALYTLLFGADAVTDFATVDLGQVLFVFTVYFSMLRQSEQGSLKATLKAMATSPVIIAITAGVVIGASGLGSLMETSDAGRVVMRALEFIAAPTAAVILFVVGYELRFRRAQMKLCVSVVLVRIIIMAALLALVLLGIGTIMPLRDTLKWAIVLMFLLPPPFVLPIFVKSEDENAFVSAALSLSTLLSLIAFAVISFLIV